MSAKTQRRQQARRNREPQTTARRSHLWRYVAAAFLLLAAFDALAASNPAPKVSAQAPPPQAAPLVAAPTPQITPASYALPQATSSTAPPAAAPASDGGDWILAPDNPLLPRTLGDIPPLPVAHSAHDPGFHPVQVQQRQTDGDTIILTCLNPFTNKTEVVVGKSGRDTIFTLNDPTKSNLRTGVIENVQVGDLVPTRDPETGKTEFRRVTRTIKHLAHETLTVQLANVATGKVVDSLTATPEHPFFVPGRGAIPLGRLGIGMQVVTRAGPPLVIASLVKHEYSQGIPVYNFEVQGDHTYFVGMANGGTWVHNDCTNVALKQLKLDGEGSLIRVEPTTTPHLEEGGWDYHDVLLRSDGTVFDPMRPRANGLPFDDWVNSWKFQNEYNFRYLSPVDHSAIGRMFR